LIKTKANASFLEAAGARIKARASPRTGAWAESFRQNLGIDIRLFVRYRSSMKPQGPPRDAGA
jgi:hypothetical protein